MNNKNDILFLEYASGPHFSQISMQLMEFKSYLFIWSYNQANFKDELETPCNKYTTAKQQGQHFF